MSLALKARQRARRKGGSRERLFGCDLREHLQRSGQDVPQVLRSCTEFVEQHGVVDGIYRLSGVSSNIQRLRQEFEAQRSPDLSRDVYLQDVHCVSSLCKAYCRELPNPLLTYQLYDKFADAVAVQMEEARLVKIKEVLKELPVCLTTGDGVGDIPEGGSVPWVGGGVPWVTLEFLMRHLLRMAGHSGRTNMHARNLAIVWAPNLLRSRDIEASGFNGTAAFMEVRVQSIVVEFILTHVEQLFGDAPLRGGDGHSVLLPGGVPPLHVPTVLSQGDGPPQMRPYHTIIELGEHRSKGSLKAKKWRSIFNLGRSGHEAKRKPGKAEEKEKCGKVTLRPAKSMDSLSSGPSGPPGDAEQTRLSLELRDSFAFLDGPETWLEGGGDAEAAARSPGSGDPPGIGDGTPRIEDGTPRIEDGTLGIEDETLGIEDGTPGIKDGTPRIEDGTLGIEDVTPGIEDGTPGIEDETLGIQDETPEIEDETPEIEDGFLAMEEGMESGFMSPGERWAEQPDSYLSIEECTERDMFFLAPGASDPDSDSDEIFLSAHDELSPPGTPEGPLGEGTDLETPENPEILEIPEIPEIPRVLEIPENPEIPEIPKVLEISEIPETPEVPVIPETPEIPKISKVLEVSEIPKIPEIPENPEIPEIPEILARTPLEKDGPGVGDPPWDPHGEGAAEGDSSPRTGLWDESPRPPKLIQDEPPQIPELIHADPPKSLHPLELIQEKPPEKLEPPRALEPIWDEPPKPLKLILHEPPKLPKLILHKPLKSLETPKSAGLIQDEPPRSLEPPRAPGMIWDEPPKSLELIQDEPPRFPEPPRPLDPIWGEPPGPLKVIQDDAPQSQDLPGPPKPIWDGCPKSLGLSLAEPPKSWDTPRPLELILVEPPKSWDPSGPPNLIRDERPKSLELILTEPPKPWDTPRALEPTLAEPPKSQDPSGPPNLIRDGRPKSLGPLPPRSSRRPLPNLGGRVLLARAVPVVPPKPHFARALRDPPGPPQITPGPPQITPGPPQITPGPSQIPPGPPQQKAAETEEGTVQIQEGSVATGEDPTSVAIASIQSAATFPDPGVKYVFRTEGGGTQVMSQVIQVVAQGFGVCVSPVSHLCQVMYRVIQVVAQGFGVCVSPVSHLCQVMYRVIQVADGQLDAQTEGNERHQRLPGHAVHDAAGGDPGAFTSEDAVETEAAPTETHYTYFPSAGVAEGAAATPATAATAAVVTTQSSEALLGQPTPTGQFFVMMSPQEVLPGGAQRSIAPRAHPYSP
ncbi:hypothetical protein DUI87_29686 [Hirundo rustica rustica]|uniref:Rho-GAP domain-containing protein n=1 Tax=Hirundo rustica rustica TaxID=333673 RepID=A0A3M0J0Z5_HIRRU|nr:hypothetical protein DUI87_29686 [Hirundo rustica rustica]